MVGSCLAALKSLPGQPSGPVRVTTKAHPSQPGGLTAEGLEAQLHESMAALGVEKVTRTHPKKKPNLHVEFVSGTELAHLFDLNKKLKLT